MKILYLGFKRLSVWSTAPMSLCYRPCYINSNEISFLFSQQFHVYYFCITTGQWIKSILLKIVYLGFKNRWRQDRAKRKLRTGKVSFATPPPQLFLFVTGVTERAKC